MPTELISVSNGRERKLFCRNWNVTWIANVQEENTITSTIGG